ncbi:MAG: CDP-glycerol glycerophosphotransferase family protein [Patescibacteria group bacterium]|nr:CDP-glycerol glycerophosphotransferase family protein [Patescibacteria group bacterium]
MTTIFLTCFQAVEVKNLLRTEVAAALLSRKDARIIALVRNEERAAYYTRELPIEGVTYAVCDPAPHGALERLMSFLKFHLIRTRTTDLRRRGHYLESRNAFAYYAGSLLNRLIVHSFVRRLLRRLDTAFVGDSGCGALFEKYQPSVVVLANLFDDGEVALLRDARRRGVPTVGFINTWDKLTARASLRLLSDRILVYNEIVRDEAERFADMPREHTSIVGVPQYDIYFTNKPMSREAFLRSIGSDPTKRLVLFAPMGTAFSKYDWYAIDLLYDLIEQQKQIPNAELFVRFQPNYFVDRQEIEKRPWLRYDLPGLRFGSERGGDWDMTREDAERLRDTLAHASLVISYASSIGIDAALMGRPVININFEIGESIGRVPSLRSPTFYYGTEHYRKALATGGIRLVGSVEELVEWTRRYLDNHELDRDGRERLVREQCAFMDGKAGERIAHAIFERVALHYQSAAV